MKKIITITAGVALILSLAACSPDEPVPAVAPIPATEPIEPIETEVEVATCTTLTKAEVARIVGEDGEPNYKGAPEFEVAGTARYDTDNDIFTELWVLHGKDGRTYTFATDPNGMLMGADGKTRKAWVWGDALVNTDSPAGRAIEEAVETADTADCIPGWEE